MSQFLKCCLCQEKEATKTNSHLITWAVIKDALNQPGFSHRGYDVTFTISNYDIPKLHVGRSVLPEHIEEVSGKQVSWNEYLDKENPLSRDYIFCPSCEDGIGKIEHEFVSQVYTKLSNTNRKNLDLDTKGNHYLLLSESESKLAYIYTYSVFFRTSVGKLMNFSLNLKIEKFLQKILLSVISNTQSETRRQINNLNKDDFKFPILLTYLDSSNDSPDKNVILQNRSDEPYFIWANNIILRLYGKKSHIESSIEHFYGLSRMINSKEYVPDERTGQILVSIISNDKRLKILDSALQYLAKDNMDNTLVLFRSAYRKFFKRKASTHEQKTFAHHFSIYSTDKVSANINEPFLKAFKTTCNIPD